MSVLEEATSRIASETLASSRPFETHSLKLLCDRRLRRSLHRSHYVDPPALETPSALCVLRRPPCPRTRRPRPHGRVL